MTPDWPAFADSIVKIWREMGWKALAGGSMVLLAWKYIDSWGKRK